MDEVSGNRVASRLITHSQRGIITLGNTSNNLIQNDKLNRKWALIVAYAVSSFSTSVTEAQAVYMYVLNVTRRTPLLIQKLFHVLR